MEVRDVCKLRNPLAHDAEQFFLQNELPLLVFLAALVGLVVLPAHGLLALSAGDVADDVATGRHAAFDGLGLGDVHDGIEEVGLTMLATEVLEVRRYCVSTFDMKEDGKDKALERSQGAS